MTHYDMQLEMENRLLSLDRRLTTLKQYLKDRLEVSDWHGVRDAASDIERLEGQRELLEDLQTEFSLPR